MLYISVKLCFCTVRNQLCNWGISLTSEQLPVFKKILASCLHSLSSGVLHRLWVMCGQLKRAKLFQTRQQLIFNSWLRISDQHICVEVVYIFVRNMSPFSLIFIGNMWDSHAGINLHKPCKRRPTINILSRFLRITEQWKTTIQWFSWSRAMRARWHID